MLGTEVLERLHKVAPNAAEEDSYLLDQSMLLYAAGVARVCDACG